MIGFQNFHLSVKLFDSNYRNCYPNYYLFYFWTMNQLDKIKKQRYETEMKIIALEDKLRNTKLSRNEEKELEFLKKKALELNKKIESLT